MNIRKLNEQAEVVENGNQQQLYVNGTVVATANNGRIKVPFEPQTDQVREAIMAFEGKVHGEAIGKKLFK